MKIKMSFILISIIVILILLSGCNGFGPEITDIFEQEYNANKNTILKVDNINGQIEISGWDEDTLKLYAIKRTRYGQDEFKNVEINVTEDNNEMMISVLYLTDRTGRVSVDMNIKVPNNITIGQVKTSNGAIVITNTKGNVTATSSNGAIILENIYGNVYAKTSNGNIEINNTTGVSGVEASNGAISVEIFDVYNDIDIKTSNGAISVDIDYMLDAEFEMKTSNGYLKISNLNSTLTRNEEHNIIGKLGNGGYKINIITSNGNIILDRI